MAKRPRHDTDFEHYCDIRDFLLGVTGHGLCRQVIIVPADRKIAKRLGAHLQRVIEAVCLDMVIGAAEDDEVCGRRFRLMVSVLDADRLKITWEDEGHGQAHIIEPDEHDPDGRHWLIYQLYRIWDPKARRPDDAVGVLSRRRM